jgi:hypothetical protein
VLTEGLNLPVVADWLALTADCLAPPPIAFDSDAVPMYARLASGEQSSSHSELHVRRTYAGFMIDFPARPLLHPHDSTTGRFEIRRAN